MIEPPNRSSLWRLDEFKSIVEPNYNDNGLFCGGRGNLASNGGKCGVCGDPYQGPYPNEAGGIYAKGIIARTYRSGQDIPVKIQITANHLGWHEFRLCVNNNISKKITHDCLDKHLLITSDTGLTRTKFSANSGIKELTLQLPKDLVCSQCVLQWKWRTANSPGRSEEEYYGCSDIAIEKSVLPNYSSLSTLLKTSSRQPTRTQAVDIVHHITSTAIPSGRKCKAISPGWKGNPYFDNWCNIQCGNTDCIDHSTFCACDQPTRTQPVDIVQHITSTAIPSGRKCKAISPGWRGNPYFDNWCNTQCGNTDCIDLSTFCACD
ncbi:unnamed protein product [Mytilus edulis]|uniref:Chitin-binding type-4 domain-containing protein n=1 Tax=Mytilus edulis TaxID=6550 RepID=A0A8S3SBR6_MYTED|nr:unnamed protein product [Mytilus edulis]